MISFSFSSFVVAPTDADYLGLFGVAMYWVEVGSKFEGIDKF